MNWLKRIGQLFASRKMQLVAVIIFAALSYILVLVTNKTIWWDDLLDPVIGFSTLLVASLVWWSEWHSDWENQLPKRLTVRFIHEGRLIMICKEAHLASEADIRSWGQQIGRQMVGGDLQFYAFFKTSQGKPINSQQGERVKPYYMTVFLSSIPPKLADQLIDKEGNYLYLRWLQVAGGQPEACYLPHPTRIPPIEQNDQL